MKRFSISIAALGMSLLCCGGALAQRGGSSGGTVSLPAPSGAGTIPAIDSNRGGFPPYGSRDVGSMGMPDSLARRSLELQEKTRNSERQKKIESDTEKLVQTVNSLKEQVDNNPSLSPDDVGKKAEEIEKLARSVKDRMKG